MKGQIFFFFFHTQNLLLIMPTVNVKTVRIRWMVAPSVATCRPFNPPRASLLFAFASRGHQEAKKELKQYEECRGKKNFVPNSLAHGATRAFIVRQPCAMVYPYEAPPQSPIRRRHALKRNAKENQTVIQLIEGISHSHSSIPAHCMN